MSGRLSWRRSVVDRKVIECEKHGTRGSHPVEAKLVNDEERGSGVEADAVMDRLVGHGGGEVVEEFAAGDVIDALFEHARRQANALDEPAFSQTGLTDEDDVLLAADEVTLGQGFDLQTGGWPG